MNERIRELREFFGKSQEDFAQSLELSRNYISLVENGQRNMSSHTIKVLCTLYDVNENWLRTGEGMMFVEKTEDEEISEMLADIQLSGSSSFKHRLAVALARLDDDGWKWLEEFVNSIALKPND
ncbi:MULTISPECIES: helix-turn-helix domain-containing protein [unclassified Roseburia]|jgi:transcriptional regulator with XRE-family HTH domain|uniref:helix-turn-helix domain-containing protein n=1 Tax=unclassified Roseburia TaxID=2637578 RepID=UPI000E48696E|nr:MULTISPECIES: helix-turn-helix transcriptional regulator [unclassified Roseburia]RGI48452.1 XRE family transcriptional regulator [Roseburia sp. OM03-7AC]RGI51650.1 XRE family transcriptional regulator [Roseburia sp. OM03-18]